MDSSVVIGSMIVLCTLVLAAMLFSGALKFALKFIAGAAIGGVGIYMIYMAFPMVNVGINAFTMSIAGLLGIPGIGILILSGIML